MVRLVESSVRDRHIVENHMQAKTEESLEFVAVEGSTRQTVRWEDGLCPTSQASGQQVDYTTFKITYATLKRTTINIITTKLTDGHCRVLMGVHLHKSKSTVRLESRFSNITEVLEKRNEVILSGVRGKVSNIAGGLPLRCLSYYHLIALYAMSREVVVAEWSGRGHSHG